MMKTCLCILCVVCLAACGRVHKGPSGYVALVRVEAKGSDQVFRLENHSTKSVFVDVVADRGNGSSPIPHAVKFECRGPQSESWTRERSETGVYDSPEQIEIKPNQQRLLNVRDEFTQKFEHGKCRLRLTVGGGTYIESENF